MTHIVIAHIREGEVSPEYHVVGEGVRLFVIDDNCPRERVYEWLRRDGPDIVAEMIPEGTEIHSNQDARHAAIENRYWSEVGGLPRLKVVDAALSPEKTGRTGDA